MGAGAGKGPAYGMPISPSSEYAEKISKKRTERAVIDAPALVDLGHGTVRYREEGTVVSSDADRQTNIKTGYFYHARLTDYSEDAAVSSEDAFKSKYIFQGPTKAKGKTLYYIYGKGMNAEDPLPQHNKKTWVNSSRNINHFYYNLKVLIQDDENDSDDEIEDLQTQVNPDLMRFVLHDTDSLDVLKKRVAVRLLIPSSIVFVEFDGNELRNEDIIGNLRGTEDGVFKTFSVELTRTTWVN